MRLPSSFVTIPRVMAEPVCLRGPLGARRESDTEGFLATYGDDRTRRYMAHIPLVLHPAMADAYFDRIQQTWTDGEDATFIVEHAGTGAFVGFAGIHAFDPAQASGEVSIALHPEARRLSTAVATLRALCAFAFDQLEMRRIVARTEIENRAAVYVASHVGFRDTGCSTATYTNPLTGQRPICREGELRLQDLIR
ncbi:GNAT family N-acetyltransferase [Streptomyces sp. NPDC093707]|uniref:GNAT family N-acetyltransferase n=1 Tax=Streptomyces sp. NPDC093707 TaxID=3154984 RepID=UPI00344B7ACF